MGAEVVGFTNGILTLSFSGKLKYTEFTAVQKAMAEIIRNAEKVRILAIVSDFEGWDKAGDWGDDSFQTKFDPKVEKMAIVGDKKWEDLTILFTGKGLRSFPIEYFLPNEFEKARTWLGEPG